MKRTAKFFIATALTLSTTGMCMGYAALSDTLSVAGTMDVQLPSGVYIFEADPVDEKATVVDYTGTVLSSRVDLGTQLNEEGNSTSSITVKLYNNSPYVYVFNDVKYTVGEGTYDNTAIEYGLTGLKKGDEIGEKAFIEFTLMFHYANPDNITDTVLNSILNFEFVAHADYVPEIAVDGALAQFKHILNTQEDFDKLITQMDDYSGNRYDDSYVGNVVGANSNDTKLMQELFTEDGKNYLTLNLSGIETNVTALIKRENVDGDTTTGVDGNEMTIYMTADDISWSVRSVTVYACVFTKIGDGEWTQIGQMYEGTATTNAYYGLFGRDSFNTETWKSAVKYYDVAVGASIIEVIAGLKRAEATATTE